MLALVSVLFVACSSGEKANNEPDKDIKELVHDYSVGNVEAASASITSSELIVTDENQE